MRRQLALPGLLLLLVSAGSACGGDVSPRKASSLAPIQASAAVSATSNPTSLAMTPITQIPTPTVHPSYSPTLVSKPVPSSATPKVEGGPMSPPEPTAESIPRTLPKPAAGAPGVGSALTPPSGPGPRPTPVSSSPESGVLGYRPVRLT